MTTCRKTRTHGAIERFACDAETRARSDAAAFPTSSPSGQRNDFEGTRALDSVRRVALITYHSSPLMDPGSDDAGGMTVYVRELAAAYARLGVRTDIFTRATGAEPRVSRLGRGVRVMAIEAGPRRALPKDRLPGYITKFVDGVRAFALGQRADYDVVHSHYWQSGLAGTSLAGLLWFGDSSEILRRFCLRRDFGSG